MAPATLLANLTEQQTIFQQSLNLQPCTAATLVANFTEQQSIFHQSLDPCTMAATLGALTAIPLLGLVRHAERKEYRKQKPTSTVKMTCKSQVPAKLRLQSSSGLTASSALDRFPSFTGQRDSNALDRLNVFHSQDDLFSEVNLSVSSQKGRGRGSSCVTYAMAEKFTDQAIEAIILSREEAPRLGHNFVGTEQILLGLIEEGTGIAAKVLKSMGINLKDARVEVEKIIGRGSGSTDIPFTPRAKRVLEFSLEEARQLGHYYIGTEHLLLGILREGEGVAARVLKSLGLDLNDVRTQVILMIGGNHEVTSKDGGGTIKTPTLDEFGTNLTKLAEEGKLYPVVGREPQIERVVQILSRETTNNPCLIGEPGVGKTAIAEGLAQLIASVNVPITLKGKTVISLNVGRLLAGTKYRGEFEERLNNLIEEVRQRGDIILFIDELHTLIGAGAAEGAIDAANILKPALARGELQCIGATTFHEYKKHMEKDPAFERRFQTVKVPEPTVEEAVQILHRLRERFEIKHHVRYTDEALLAAAELSHQYISDRFLPAKAIALIDDAGVGVRLRDHAQGKEVSKAQTEGGIVTVSDIEHVVSTETGIPVGQVSSDESSRLLNMEEILHKRVIGQDEVVKAVSRASRRARVRIKKRNRPIASFIFAGPTGVGKTELAKALAATYFGSEAMIRLDMSEFMERHAVSKLIGSPPGYVGYTEGGQLTEAVRRRPHSLVLFDEIEKAHPDVFNMMLQILADGRLTDSQGRTVDFKNTLIIMTSNVGSSVIINGGKSNLEYEEEDSRYKRIKSLVTEEMKQYFRPEFLNRLNEEEGIELQVTERFIERVVDEGFDPSYGARPLSRAIERLLEDTMTEKILSNEITKGDSVIVDVDAQGSVLVLNGNNNACKT
ncbi:unnamed protein product [Microthlaspi erraticum]|uniref:Clp R domain-containing protein n=1 Tax=Microthlaspi erraticum TaxID=1685480 RepID=A0A6D2J858_9BRAS|nr:unnamed protein product [Microthlaspi erraticum]